MAINKSDIGSYFVSIGELTEKQLSEALKKQNKTGKRLEEILQDEGYVSEEKIKDFLRNQYNIVSVDLIKQEINPEVPLLISEDIARDYILIPFKKSNYRLLVAMVDPYDLEAIDEIHKATGLTVLPRKARARDIMQMIEIYYSGKDAKEIEKAVENLRKSVEQAEREAREKEREAREKAEREAKERAEREAREKEEREAREKAEKEAREKAEREAREKAEREAREKEEKEAREKAEREAREKAEREAKERAEREAREKEGETKQDNVKNFVEEAEKEGKSENLTEYNKNEKLTVELSEDLSKNKKSKVGLKSLQNKSIQERIKEIKKQSPNKRMKLGEVLVEAGLLTEENLQAALKIQKEKKSKLGEILVDNGLILENDMVTVLSELMGFPYVELSKLMLDPKIPALIKESLARKYVLIPIKIENGRLVVAMSDPLNIYAIDDIRIATGYGVIPYIAGKRDILRAIELYYGQQSTEEAVEDLMKELDVDEIKGLDQETLNEINNAPLVRLVNSLLRQAITMKASDVHIEPFENYVRVRFRIDGDLQEIMSLDINTLPAVVARIKIMGKMDIAEKRIPQDGRVGIKLDDRRIDLRLSTLPTTYGEKVVIRILDKENVFIHKSQLGFTPANIERLNRIIRYPYGIILVTGPTGSGKTSTLYTILSELNKVNRNIITIEDPIEFKINGLNQVQVNPKANLTFASGLRSILRQDPDIIMVGEIRDTETVEIAVRAAITGHLVLSTIHTNDTASTIVRLIDMGIEPYLISSALVGIIAQRLVKKICPDCKEEYIATEEEKKLLGLKEDVPLYCGGGCSNCNNTGYKGRTAIAEIMLINSQIKQLIDQGKNTEEIKRAAKEQGMIDLEENCRELVLKGVTTVDEYIRNTYIL